MKKRTSHWPLTLLGSASALFNLFLPIVMSRRVSAAGVGEFKVFFLYLAAVPALSLGVGFTNGTYLWGSEGKSSDIKIRSALLLAFFSGVVAAAAVLFWSAFQALTPSTLFFAIACPPAVASGIYEARLVASGKVREGALFSAGFEFLRLALMLAAVFAGCNALALFGVHALVSWAKLATALVRVGLISPFDTAFSRVRSELISYALPVSLAAVFDLLVLNADRYVLAALLTTGEFAIYAFGCLMVPPLFVFEQSVNQVLIPKLSATKRASLKGIALYRRAVEDLLLLLLPATAGLIVLADPLVRVLFSDAYRAAATFLPWYALYYALSSVPQDVFARARGNSKWILGTAISFGLLALLATFSSAYSFGALGALKAFVLVQLGRRVYAILYFARSEQTTVARLFPVKAFTQLLLASGAAGAAALLVSSQLKHPFHSFLLGSAAFCPVYFGLVYLMNPSSLRRIFRRRGKR